MLLGCDEICCKEIYMIEHLQLLKIIQADSRKYIYEKSLTCLLSFLDGYRHAAYEDGRKIEEDTKFEDFIIEYYGVKYNSLINDEHKSVGYILLNSSSEEEAFEKYIQLYSMFCSKEGKQNG